MAPAAVSLTSLNFHTDKSDKGLTSVILTVAGEPDKDHMSSGFFPKPGLQIFRLEYSS